GPQGAQGNVGPQGPQGVKGDTGEFGGATFEYNFVDLTSDPVDTGNGNLRFNANPFTTATAMYISFVDSNAANVFNYLTTIDDSTSTIKGTFKIANSANVLLHTPLVQQLHLQTILQLSSRL
ncbi:MAG: collagen-like protein, partial [Proteobacteria bacterium]|nr:collagen-like protein [Pseudomonadota bacterium]